MRHHLPPPCVLSHPRRRGACLASHPAGMSFARLFQQCRERFLVSNEMLLKAFLTEFKDHELLQTK
jgi:hypothetical protein